MAIELVGTVPEPALDYKNIFLKELKIEQDYTYLETDAPMYNLNINYQVYALANGQKIFDSTVYNIVVPDYLNEASSKALAGKPNMLDALTAIQLVFSDLLVSNSIDSIVI